MMSSLTAALIGFAPALQPLALRSPARSSAALGHPMMYGAMASKKMDAREEGGPPSFVQTEMRSAAMALHTMQQAPKEGKAPQKKVEQTPVQEWQPGRAEYLQFLVDSREVYRTLEDIVSRTPALAPFRESGLERSEALSRDIAWFTEQGVAEPPVAEQGATYVKMLTEMADANEIEAFVCHFYNTYFAHTAGGRMIGKKMSNLLLEGRTLDFYSWDGDVDKVLLPALRLRIDELVDTWTREQKDACLAQTADSFKFGGALLQHISRPAPARA